MSALLRYLQTSTCSAIAVREINRALQSNSLPVENAIYQQIALVSVAWPLARRRLGAEAKRGRLCSVIFPQVRGFGTLFPICFTKYIGPAGGAELCTFDHG